MRYPERIISGGQTGADQGGLIAARQAGIATGGAAPNGWWTEAGPQESLLRGFGLAECAEDGYAARTRANVGDSDGTLLIGPYTDGGSALTSACAASSGKPVFYVPYLRDAALDLGHVEEFLDWLARHRILTLNVAGNRESRNPGIQEFTRAFLSAALSLSRAARD